MEKVTREDLRQMTVGETRVFQLPNAQSCDSGKTVAYQMQNLLNCKFVCATDYVNNTLTITRQ